MKQLFITILLFSITLLLQGQDLEVDLEFKTKEDYRTHEPSIKRIAEYLLNTPVSDDRPVTKMAGATLLKWMTGTPDYKFELDNTLTVFSKGNEAVLIPILASMTSFVLNNREKAADKNEVKLQAYIIFLNYCQQKQNGVRQTREIKRGIEAKNNGDLKKYLKI